MSSTRIVSNDGSKDLLTDLEKKSIEEDKRIKLQSLMDMYNQMNGNPRQIIDSVKDGNKTIYGMSHAITFKPIERSVAPEAKKIHEYTDEEKTLYKSGKGSCSL